MWSTRCGSQANEIDRAAPFAWLLRCARINNIKKAANLHQNKDLAVHVSFTIQRIEPFLEY